MFGTFIIDFQTTDFGPDSKIATDLFAALQNDCKIENAFALDEPVQSAGWSFAKLFLSGEFVDRIYSLNSHEIDTTKGRKVEDRMISWLGSRLKNSKCTAQIKMAPEMKSL